MKVIQENLISSVTADTENTNYPANNLIDNDHPKKVWKAMSSSAVLTFVLNGTSSGMCIHNTNATGITFEIEDPNAIRWATGIEWVDGIEWNNDIYSGTALTNLDGVTGAALYEWDEINAGLTVRVTMAQSDGEMLYAGIADAGKIYEFPGMYGIEESGDDLSIVDELSNGSRYVLDRDYVRTFEMPFMLTTATDFHSLMGNVVRKIKSNPRTWLVTNESDSRWLVYAAIISATGNHSTYYYTSGRIQIREVV